MKVESYRYPGWPDHPSYIVGTYKEYIEITDWMYKNKIDQFLLSSSSTGYIFQVRTNHEWFLLRWL